MNFLSPDDIFNGVRRKSLCNGTLLSLSSKNNSNSGDSGSSTPTKNKKERRRGSFNEASANNGRRASLVSRWFKHISDAAEQYKPRSKNANQEAADDSPAAATLSHSTAKESVEVTPERAPPITVVNTPLAPMMTVTPTPTPTATPSIIVNNNNNNNNNVNNSNNNNNGYNESGVQLRNSRRESTPTPTESTTNSGGFHKKRMSHNELSTSSSSVNRTMSTRSCGENNNTYSNDCVINGVTLRHTQSAREATGSQNDGSLDEGVSKRDTPITSFTQNTINTRTIIQTTPVVIERSAINISVTRSHIANPNVQATERLRWIDAAIRDGLLEKQKIICDMFRVPIEHFNEIVDIASMPEAPKDSADIALAAYAQVQTLTEVVNGYMKMSTDDQQDSSDNVTTNSNECNGKQQFSQSATAPVGQDSSTSSLSSASNLPQTEQKSVAVDPSIPPPLPPPNKLSAHTQHKIPPILTPKIQTSEFENVRDIHEDDDGYCEIDEIRLPALPPKLSMATPTLCHSSMPISNADISISQSANVSNCIKESPAILSTPILSGAETPPTSPTAVTTTGSPKEVTAPQTVNCTPELVKRQSTISSDSIPEESADEVTKAMREESNHNDKVVEEKSIEPEEWIKLEQKECEETDNLTKVVEETEHDIKMETSGENLIESPMESSRFNAVILSDTESGAAEESNEKEDDTRSEEANQITDVKSIKESPEIEASNETITTLNKLNTALSMVDNMTQTLSSMFISGTNANIGSYITGSSRTPQTNCLEPSVPCHALNSIVSALNQQISLLLPKISERDVERENLRKENQELREKLKTMQERMRVKSELETPPDIVTVDHEKNDNHDDDNNDDNDDDGKSPKSSIPGQTLSSTPINQTTNTNTNTNTNIN